MSRNLLKWVFFFQCILLFYLVAITEGFEGGADAVVHWFISRDAPSEPMLFLDQWNKPIFTVLSAPFAQIGMIGMRIFSTLSGILTALLLWQISKKELVKYAWLPAVILFLIPQYFVLLTSSMTEPLFALFFALFLFLVSKEKLGWAAVIAGFSPFVRQEGMALIPLIILLLVYRKQLLKIPLVFLGTAVFTLIGWAVSGDILWIKTSFPYGSGSSDIYGSGELFHYLKYWKILFGISIAIAMVIGALSLLKDSVFSLLSKERLTSYQLAMLSAFAFGLMFFSAHSYVWWKGISGSLGLIRVMASIAPAVALVAAFGLYRLLQVPSFKKPVITFSIVAAFIISAGFQLYNEVNLPTPLGQAQIVMQRTADWLREQSIENEVHYADPTFSHFGMGLNYASPINKGPMPHERLDELPLGDVVVWDAHFSPNEGRMPLDVLLNHPNFNRIKTLKPDQSFNVLGDKPYVVHIFQKSDKFYKTEVVNGVLAFEDFEAENQEFLRLEAAGIDKSFAAISDENHEYVTIRIPMESAMMDTIMGLKLQAYIKSDSELDLSKIHLVSSIADKHYRSIEATRIESFQVGDWNQFIQEFELPNGLPEHFELTCYVWNQDKQKFLVDDLKLEYTSLKSVAE